jgi:Fe-S cluster assembly ATP-binding protein
MREMLKVEDLWVSVGGTQVLKGVNFSMNYGEINILFGPNGAGKTTFMMTLMGFPRYKIEQGRIYLRDRIYR